MTFEQKIMDILYAELSVSVYDECSASIEGREEAMRRIVNEIIHPILADQKST